MKSHKRIWAAPIALGILVAAVAPQTAAAYRSNNSNWNDYNKVSWSGLTGG